MKELDGLRKGLKISNLLIVKDRGGTLECSFLKGGLVKCMVVVEDEILADVLRQKADFGILEGIPFNIFKHEFDNLALHVKARKLYRELAFKLPMYPVPAVKEELYEPVPGVAVA